MIEVFVLIGWIDGYRSGGVVSQEFNSLAACEAVKTLFIDMHNTQPKEEPSYGHESWVECVKK